MSIPNKCCHWNTASIWWRKSSSATGDNAVIITHRELVKCVRTMVF